MKASPRVLVGLLAALAACGGPAGRPDGKDPDLNATPDAQTSTIDGSTDDGCADGSRLIYVLDKANKLSTFDPPTKAFVTLGTLDCDTGFATPFSMGIDRDAIAWVLYNDGRLFRVDPKTLQCTNTNWAKPLGLTQFGMGFSADVAGGTTDSLFVAGGLTTSSATTSTLATVNPSTMATTMVSTLNGWPELTGTGSGELWAFFPDTANSRIEQLDKGNGSTMTTFPLATLNGARQSWAFAFWGGDFWVFLKRDMETESTIYQVDASNGAIQSMTSSDGRSIVGAGVSTCAPIIF
ncbi:MAG: hypothetical protein AB7P03_23010 [Kofleriaceae bacterium]